MRRILKNSLLCLLGSAILAFGLCHVHAVSSVTEGGVLGLTLWLYQTFSISPALTSLLMNAACYLFGFRVLGLSFIGYSAIAGGGFSVFYFLFDLFPPLFQELSSRPLLAAVLGALFVGIGVGLCVVAGGAPSGDDALAMALSAKTKKDIRIFYLLSDILVLSLSLTYIPPRRIFYSLITVILSGQIIGLMQRLFAILSKKT
jgi:uncharacterized membrane-anchored protein YitT (DUF2179 family)